MTLETIIGYATALAAVVALVIWGLKRYKQLAADGHISVGEVLEAIEDAKEEVAETQEEVKEALKKD